MAVPALDAEYVVCSILTRSMFVPIISINFMSTPSYEQRSEYGVCIIYMCILNIQ